MPVTPTKPQLAIYAAVVVAVLLIGSRFLREGAGAETASPAFAPVTTSAGSPDGLSAVAGDDAAGGAMNPDGVRLVVDVKGAVRRPGVYRLPADARTYDAVRRAGGLTRRADRVGVNLAARVVDGGEVVVPERTPGVRGSTAAAPPTAGAGETGAAA